MKKYQGWLITSSLVLTALAGAIFLSNKNGALQVRADESDYEVYISGVGQSSGSLLSPGATVNGNSGSVTYTRDSNGDVTLTFNNFKWSGNSICDTAGGNSVAHMVHVQAKGHNVNVVVNGTNTINSTGVDNTTTINNLGVYFWASEVKFTGSGSLTYTAGGNVKNANSALYLSSVNKLTIDGPSLSFTGGTAGNNYNNGGDTYGAYLSGVSFYLKSGSFTARGGTAVSGTGGAPADGVAYGFYNRFGNIYLEGGSFTAIGGTCGTGSDAMSVGLITDANNWTKVQVSKTIEKLTIAASKNNDVKYVGVVGPITTGPVAYSWTNKDGTGTPTEYPKDKYNYFYASDGIRRLYAEGSQVEYTATGYNGNYDGEAHTIGGITVSEPTGVDYTIKYGTTSGTYNLDTPPTRTDAGTTTVYFKLTVDGYDPIEDSVQIVVNKVNPTVTTIPVRASNCDFDGNSHALIQTAGVATGGTVQYSVDGGEYSSSIPSRTEAGSYAVSYRVKGDGNHKDISGVSLGTVTINKATITNHSVSVSQTYKYTGSPITPAVNTQATTVGGKATTFTYSTTEGSGYGNMPSFTNAGKYTIYYKVSAQSHNDAFGSFEFNLGKADAPALSDDQKATAKSSLVYTGSAQDLVSSPVAPLASSDGYVEIRYSVKGSSESSWSEWSTTIPSVTDAGYYDVRFYYVGDSNHTDTAPITISNIYLDKAASVISVSPTAVDGLHYTGEAQELIVAGETSDGTFKYSLDGTNYSTSTPTAINVDSYTVYYYVEGDANHYDSEPLTIVNGIAENDKTALIAKIDDANSFYNDILADYPTIANTLKEAINAANAVKTNPNVTVQQIEDAVNALNVALTKAQQDHSDIKNTVEAIKNIGTVENTAECAEKIKGARSLYDGLTEYQQSLVDNYQVLVDDEHVHTALVKIDAIGEVKYDTESENAIRKAREYYDSLSEEQKTQLGEEPLTTLTNAETRYATLKKTATILVIILLIVIGLSIVGGILFLFFLLKRKKDKDDDNNQNTPKGKGKPVKAMSVGGLLPFIILTSHYVDSPWIAFYVLAGVAVLLWIVILVIAVMKKKAVGPFKKTAMANNEDEEVETVTDEKGNVFQIRYVKSFTAKLIQSPEGTKKYYEELKNEVLSYKKTNSRVSWHYDAVNAGREYVIKFAIRGKTLCVYLPLDASKLEEKYKVEKSESKRFEDVPCMYRIKNDRRCVYAKDLIAQVCEKLGLEKGEEQHEVYSNLPYEANKPLVARGLIKELKVQIKKAESEVLERKVNADGDEVVVTKDAKGNIFEIRYVKSFTAKLSQSEQVTKDYYNVLKNYVLSYKGTHSRVSWHYDAINVGRDYVLKFAIRGKTLCVYYALDASKLEEKYKVEEAKGRRYEDVPVLYRIKNDRRCEFAKELIDLLMKQMGVEKGEELGEDYRVATESTKALLAKGLIKELKVQIKKVEEEVVERKVNADGDEVIVKKDASGNLIEIRYIKSFTAKLSQSDELVKDYYTILKNYVLSYKDTHSRVSWHYDAINVGRDYVLKFAIRGKTLCVYYALDASQIDEKYKVEEAKGRKFVDVPVLYRIKNDRRCQYAKELIDQLMKKMKVSKGQEQNEDYRIAKESTKALLAKGLIKEVKTKIGSSKQVELHSISVSKADEMMSDEKAEALVELDTVHHHEKGSKEIINIDTLSQNYKDGDVVDLKSLKEKKLVSPKTGYVKVLARGVLDKKLTVDLDDYSLQAVKMIVLLGGHAKKIK